MTMKVDGTVGVTYPDTTVQVSAAGFGGATTNATSSSAITLTAASTQYQVAQISSYANSYVTLPDATTMRQVGSNPFVIENRSPIGANLELRNSAGATVGYIPIGQIGTIQLKNNSTAAGAWVVETVNPQTFIKYDGASIVSAATSPAPTNATGIGILGLSATTFVRYWCVTSAGGTQTYNYVYTQVCTISGSTITVGATQSYNFYNSAAGYPYGYTSMVRAVRLSNTSFTVFMSANAIINDACTGTRYMAYTYIQTNTVSGTTVTFGSPTNLQGYISGYVSYPNTASYNTITALLYNAVITRVSDTSFAVLYNDNYTGSYTYPYNYSGSLSCYIVSVSGTTQTWGTKATLGTSTYTQPISAVALSSTAVAVAYAQATAAGGSSGRTKLNVVSVSGTTPTFNTSTTCETSDVFCFGTAYCDAAVASSATQFLFNSAYAVGEATVSGTTVTFDAFCKSGQSAPMFLSSATRVCTKDASWTTNKVYLDIATGGFVTNTNTVDVLQSNLTVTSAFPMAALGAQPTTAFVGVKTNTLSTDPCTYILGTTT